MRGALIYQRKPGMSSAYLVWQKGLLSMNHSDQKERQRDLAEKW